MSLKAEARKNLEEQGSVRNNKHMNEDEAERSNGVVILYELVQNKCLRSRAGIECLKQMKLIRHETVQKSIDFMHKIFKLACLMDRAKDTDQR